MAKVSTRRSVSVKAVTYARMTNAIASGAVTGSISGYDPDGEVAGAIFTF